MQTGLLWYRENPKQPIEETVQRAADFYRAKYNVVPNVCHMHPRMLPPTGEPRTIAGISCKPARNVILNHLWLGVENQPLAKESGGTPQANL